MFALIISSCTKGDIVNAPQFGRILVNKFSPEEIEIVKGDGEALKFGFVSNSISGSNRFRIYQTGSLLLDTQIYVKPYLTNNYIMFKPNQSSHPRILDTDYHGFSKEEYPDSGYIKLSLANFSTSLPNKVSISVSTTTYTPFTDKPIQVGEYLNISDAFSDFHRVACGTTSSSSRQNQFTLTVKDISGQLVLATFPLTIVNEVTPGKVNNTVYLVYLDNNGATILMSK